MFGRAVTRSSLEREVRGSNLGPVKSDTVLPTAHHRCDISSKGAVLPGRNDEEMGPANSLHALAYYSKYNERFDFELHACCLIKYSAKFYIYQNNKSVILALSVISDYWQLVQKFNNLFFNLQISKQSCAIHFKKYSK